MVLGCNYVSRPFNKQDAIRMWIEEHHPHLVIRFDRTKGTRLGYCVIARTKAIVDAAGTMLSPKTSQMVEIDFDVHGFKGNKPNVDWFFSHDPRTQDEALITNPDYFEKLEAMLKLTKLI